MPDPSQQADPKKSPLRLRRILLIAGIVVLVVSAALIAIPNRHHPAVRGRNATVPAEMRDIAVALEAFRMANGRLPTVREFYTADRLPNAIPPDDPPIEFTLTSPVAFLPALPGDPYSTSSRRYHYFCFTDVKTCWVLASRGPDHDADFFAGGGSNECENVRIRRLQPAARGRSALFRSGKQGRRARHERHGLRSNQRPVRQQRRYHQDRPVTTSGARHA